MAARAPAPVAEPQNQRPSIIRDFTAAARSHGGRAASGLKRRLDDAATPPELQASKRAREGAETELRRLQASIAVTATVVLQATNSNLQKDITRVGSELEQLKRKNASERDEFISQMLDMNARIRQFQQMASVDIAGKCSELSADGKQGKATDSNQGKATDGHYVSYKNETAGSEGISTDLADKLCQEVADARAKRALIEAVMEKTRRFRRSRRHEEVGGRVAEMEKVHSSVAEEL